MQRAGLVVMAVALAVAAGLSAAAAKPLISAHGELRGSLHLAGDALDLQIAFNVQGRGAEGDHGSISIRVFDQFTGKLAGVMVSTGIRFIEIMADGGVYFQAALRLAGGGTPPGPPWWFFRVYDGPDRFFLLGPEIPIDRGKIFVRY